MSNPLVGWSYCRLSNFLGKVKFARMLQRAINFFNKTRRSNKYIIILLEFRFFRFEKVVMFSIFLMRFCVLCERSDRDFEIQAENLHSSVFKNGFFITLSSRRKKAYLIDKTLFLARPSLN